jgi:hypothetical protein
MPEIGRPKGARSLSEENRESAGQFDSRTFFRREHLNHRIQLASRIGYLVRLPHRLHRRGLTAVA